MFPKRQRFTGNTFEFYRRRMKTFRVGDFLFFYSISKHGSSHFAAVISKKVITSAVIRNKFRRKMYQIFRKKEKKIPSQIQLISLCQKPPLPTNSQCEEAVSKLVQYLQIIEKK